MRDRRRRYAIGVVLATAGTAFAISLALMWFLDPPWSLLGVPLGAALGWWSGRTVLSRVLLVERRSHRADAD